MSPAHSFLARGREPRGRKSRRCHCGKAIEAPAVLWPDHAIDETARVARQTAFQGEDVADMGPRKRRRSWGEGTETLAYRKAAITLSAAARQRNADTNACQPMVSVRSIAASRE